MCYRWSTSPPPDLIDVIAQEIDGVGYRLDVSSQVVQGDADECSPMNLVTGLWGMNVHVPGQDITEGVSTRSAFICELMRAVRVVWWNIGVSRSFRSPWRLGHSELREGEQVRR